MKIVFCPYWESDHNEDLLGYPHGWVGDRYKEPLRKLKIEGEANGIEMYGADYGDYAHADIFVFWERPDIDDKIFRYALQSGKPMILLATEPPGLIPLNADSKNELLFEKIFSWYGEVSKIRQRMRPIYFAYPESVPSYKFTERKLCVMIASIYTRNNDSCELYSKRAEAVRWFEEYHPEEMDFYGRQNQFTDIQYSIYRGPVDEKLDVLSKYRFQICYENSYAIPGYISEKIFDAFFAGCVPIYWGAVDVTNYIPKKCFIDKREFESYEALYNYIQAIDEETYMDYQKNIQAFLESEFAHSYDETALAKTLIPVFVEMGK